MLKIVERANFPACWRPRCLRGCPATRVVRRAAGGSDRMSCRVRAAVKCSIDIPGRLSMPPCVRALRPDSRISNARHLRSSSPERRAGAVAVERGPADTRACRESHNTHTWVPEISKLKQGRVRQVQVLWPRLHAGAGAHAGPAGVRHCRHRARARRGMAGATGKGPDFHFPENDGGGIRYDGAAVQKCRVGHDRHGRLAETPSAISLSFVKVALRAEKFRRKKYVVLQGGNPDRLVLLRKI